MPENVIRLDDGWRFDDGHRMDEPPLVTLPVVPPVHRKRVNTMSQDFVPDPRDQRYRWYKNISTNVVAEAVKFGAAAGDATAVKAVVDGMIAKMDATDTAQTAVNAARELEHSTEATGLAQLRAKFRNWKTLAGWAASGSDEVLQVRGTSSAFDANSYKPVIQAALTVGGVRLSFTKKGAEGMNFYSRVAGTTAWHKIGMHTHSPFIDSTPLAQAGVAETREYMARGVVNDAEIGVNSDAVIITVAA